MHKAVQGGGVALGALALLVMSGISAAAAPDSSGAEDAVVAIDAIVGDLRTDAVVVSDINAELVAGATVVEFSGDAADGLTAEGLGGVDVEIGLPFATEAEAGDIVDGSVVYDNNNGSTTTPLVNTDGSLQIVTTIADASAPSAFTYDLELEEGSTVALQGDGSVEIVDAGGAVVATVAAPWAFDANGAPVPTHYTVHGYELTQVVEHSGAAYPVVADPKLTFGLVTGTLYFNKSETRDFSTAGSLVAACAAVGRVPEVGAVLLVACLAVGISWMVQANRANNRGMCLKIKFTLPINPLGTWWPDIYSGGYCK